MERAVGRAAGPGPGGMGDSVPRSWRGTYRLLCGLGSHDLSAMRELLGPPAPGRRGAAMAQRRLHRRTARVRRLRRGRTRPASTTSCGSTPTSRCTATRRSCGCSTTRRTCGTSRPPWSSRRRWVTRYRAIVHPAAPQGPVHARAGVVPRRSSPATARRRPARGLRRGHGAVHRAHPGDRAGECRVGRTRDRKIVLVRRNSVTAEGPRHTYRRGRDLVRRRREGT